MRPKFTKIVCAVDASEHSEAVLAAAVEMAHCHGARLVVATVLESIQTFMHARMEEYLHDDQRQQLQREGRARLEKAPHEPPMRRSRSPSSRGARRRRSSSTPRSSRRAWWCSAATATARSANC